MNKIKLIAYLLKKKEGDSDDEEEEEPESTGKRRRGKGIRDKGKKKSKKKQKNPKRKPEQPSRPRPPSRPLQSSTSPPPPFIMSYSRGDPCWNGPRRSVNVFLHCGIENKIKDVVENGRCHYEFTFESPAVCNERILTQLSKTLQFQKSSFSKAKAKKPKLKEDL